MHMVTIMVCGICLAASANAQMFQAPAPLIQPITSGLKDSDDGWRVQLSQQPQPTAPPQRKMSALERNALAARGKSSPGTRDGYAPADG